MSLRNKDYCNCYQATAYYNLVVEFRNALARSDKAALAKAIDQADEFILGMADFEATEEES